MVDSFLMLLGNCFERMQFVSFEQNGERETFCVCFIAKKSCLARKIVRT